MGIARIVISALAGIGLLQATLLSSAEPALAQKRVALVIGNDRYPNLPAERQLLKAVNDAEAVGDTLGRLGFEVIRGQNLGRQAMIDKLSDLTARVEAGDTAFVFYAGHGVAIGGINYLVPSDVPRVVDGAEARVRGGSIAEGDIIAELQGKGIRVAVLVIDACRDNPFPRAGGRSVGNTRGLADARPARGVFTFYSAGIGQTALDRLEPNDSNRNSVFTRVFVEQLAKPGLHLSDLAVEVRERVAEIALKARNGAGREEPHEQTPAYYDQTIGGRIYLAGLPVTGSAATPPKPADTPPRDVAGLPPADAARSIHDMVQRVGGAVVSITAKRPAKAGADASKVPAGQVFEEFFKDFFCKDKGKDCDPKAESEKSVTNIASGFVVDAAGLIVTTDSAIDQATEITATFNDGVKLKAEVVGRDPRTNLALLKIRPHKALGVIRLGDSKDLLIGSRVVVIGNPMGLSGTVSSGTVSALHRDLNSGPYDDYIQTDAGAGKGYAGAPLLTPEGDAVGVVASLLGPQNGTPSNTAFAIPSSMVSAVTDELRRHGEVRRATLGVRIQSITKELAESLNVKERGALVAGVNDGGPAQAGGIAAGDIILKFNGRDIEQWRDLPRLVASTPIGKDVEIVIHRKGKEEIRTTRLARLDETPKVAPAAATPAAGTNGSIVKAALGLDLAALDEDLRKRHKIVRKAQGVVVTAVKPDSAAADKKLVVGDVIAEVAQEKVADPNDADRRIAALRSKGTKSVLLLIVNANGDSRFMALPLQ